MLNLQEKNCSLCKQKKSIMLFNKNQNYCKDCQKIKRSSKTEEQKLAELNYAKEYRKNNKERVKKYNETYRKDNKEKVKQLLLNWKSENKNKTRLHDRKKKLKRLYNLSVEEHDNLAVSQNFKCLICTKEETLIDKRTNQVKRLAIDHDHNTGEVRGLLCFRCNTGLGFFDDNFELMQKAIDYLKIARSKG